MGGRDGSLTWKDGREELVFAEMQLG